MSSSDECRRLQHEEFEVLESIYPECLSSEITDGTLKLEVPIEFGVPRTIVLTHIAVRPASMSAPTSEEHTNSTTEVITTSTLPPLLVNVHLPDTYPLTTPPTLISIRATHLWLPQSGRLYKLLIDMWQPGDGALYAWIEYMRTGEFLEALNLVGREDSNITIHSPSPAALAARLIAYGISSRSSQFARNTYPCEICLSTLKGSQCLQLSCQHIFCRACLQDFWSMCITEGDVGRVGCPDPECVKDGREADEEEVARAVTDEEVARWKWLREKRALDKDATIVQCPVDSCQALVTQPLEGESRNWEKFRQCPRCMFSFCVTCRRIWHGPVTDCARPELVRIGPDPEKVLFEYLKAEKEGPEAKATVEAKYGKKVVRNMAKRFRDEQANQAYLASSTTKCPGCAVHIEKTHGCNHITCFKCGQHFCYRCGAPLPEINTYQHYSQPGGACYQKLYTLEGED